MALIDIVMPKMGESVAEATITEWLVQEGEQVEAEDSVLEIATDKVDSEIPAPETGIITQHLYKKGDVVNVGETIAKMETKAKETKEEKVEPTPVENDAATVEQNIETVTHDFMSGDTQKIPKTSSSGKFFSPLVRSIAKKEDISVHELEQIQGSGLNQRVTKKDILAFISNKGDASTKEIALEPKVETQSTQAAPTEEKQKNQTKQNDSLTPTQSKPKKAAEIKIGAGDEIEEMGRMRKLIAEHMVTSKRVSPHVTSFVEADVTNIVKWRNKIKKSFLEKEGEKITYTPIFVEAIVKAIKDFPNINVSVDGTKIIKRKNINIGIATALPSGNLIVPVIKNADRFNLAGLAKMINDLANRARENKLSPDEIQGGTYTITNVGTFGNVMGTPIINQPQVAIMAIGAIRKLPAVIETPEGDLIGIRNKLFLSHAYDHRVVDGALGGMFVKRVSDYLEDFDINRTL